MTKPKYDQLPILVVGFANSYSIYILQDVQYIFVQACAACQPAQPN